MKQVSEQFKQTVQGSHKVALEATVHAPDGSVTPLEVIDGSVSLDASAAIRGRCDLTLNGSEWVPRDPADRLAPYGAEIRIRKGVYLPDGSKEMVSLGWFGIEDVEIADDGLETRVAGLDRSQRLSHALIEDYVQFAPNTPFMEALVQLAQEAWPEVPMQDGLASVSDMTVGTPFNANPGEDRWTHMLDLAHSAGLSLFFDGDGILTARQYAEQSPVADVVEGEDGVLVEASRSWSRTGSFNRVIVTGESVGLEVSRGIATDDDPTSPTYYYGQFGRCPTFYSDELIDSDAKAEHVARTKLALELGSAHSVSFGLVPNPALEPDDTIRVKRERLGINEEHVIESLTIDLGPGGLMTGKTRQRLVQV